MPCSQTPGKRNPACLYRRFRVDFRARKHVILPDYVISGLNHFSLTAYGLTARCPTLNRTSYPVRSKDSLPSGWLDLPGRASHPLEYATLPGRTTSPSYFAVGEIRRGRFVDFHTHQRDSTPRYMFLEKFLESGMEFELALLNGSYPNLYWI